MSAAAGADHGRIAVFCGSNRGCEPGHTVLAGELGRRLADADVGLVYGGGRVGLMGVVADAVLASGGEVIGVIPERLFGAEVAHEGVTELHKVPDMHARKALMYSLADGFCALPGGLGTFEEVFEAATWTQLGLHDRPKPVVLLDDDGFWAPLAGFLAQAVDLGFIRSANAGIIRRVEGVAAALGELGIRVDD